MIWKAPVLVDVDDVVCKLRGLLCEAMCDASGKDIHYSEWTHSRLHDTYGISKGDVLRAMLQHEILERSMPEDDAHAALNALREAAHPVILVTKRGWHPNAEALTYQWFNYHRLPFNFLRVVSMNDSKLEAYANFAMEFAAIIDDQPSNLDEAQDSGIVRATHLIDRPWNKANSDHDRSYSLHEAVIKILNREAANEREGHSHRPKRQAPFKGIGRR